jgi:hypothetical protein
MCDMCNGTGWYRFDGDDLTCPFCDGMPCVLVGKYRGHPYADVPSSYCEWVRTLSTFADKRFFKWVNTKKG